MPTTAKKSQRPPPRATLRAHRPRRPHLRARHQRAAGRPGGAAPVRRARGGAAGRGDHRAGGQAAPPRAGLLRPHRAADARRAAGPPRPPRRAGPGGRRGRHDPGRAQPHRPRSRCRRASGSATTTPGSWRWPATSPTRATTSRWSPRTCRCGSRPPRSASTPRSTAPRRSATPTPATPAWPSSRWRPPTSTSCTTTARSTSPRRATCPATRAWCCSPTGVRRWAGSARTSRSTWSAATGRRSASTAAPPSSGSRWRCCSTPRSASSRSAAAPAPASPRWRCAPASRR